MTSRGNHCVLCEGLTHTAASASEMDPHVVRTSSSPPQSSVKRSASNPGRDNVSLRNASSEKGGGGIVAMSSVGLKKKIKYV